MNDPSRFYRWLLLVASLVTIAYLVGAAVHENYLAQCAHEMDRTHLNGWSAKTEKLPNGVVLTVTSANAKEVSHIRGLGFIGIMVSGPHHQPHHLAMARGEMMMH